MKALEDLNIAEQIVTLAKLWSVMSAGGADNLSAIAGGSLVVSFADEASVDRAFTALIRMFSVGIVFDPCEVRSPDRKHRWRTATLCLGQGRHIYLSGPHMPVLEVA